MTENFSQGECDGSVDHPASVTQDKACRRDLLQVPPMQAGEASPNERRDRLRIRRERPACLLRECCGENDRKDMISTGKAVLYLTCEPASKMRLNGQPYTIATLNQGIGRSTKGTVSNWPGTMKFDCYTTVGHHNIARYRYDCWFTGPDGKRWHGVTYGDNTQICRCRRLKD